MDPSPPDEDRGEEVHPAGDLPETLQDGGGQVEDRLEEESPPGTSPPQVPPKVLTQLSVGDGECGPCGGRLMDVAAVQLQRFIQSRCSMFWTEEINNI